MCNTFVYHMLHLSLSRTELMADKTKRKKRRELTEDQKHEIKEAFELFDTGKDKEIDYHELKVSTGWWEENKFDS